MAVGDQQHVASVDRIGLIGLVGFSKNGSMITVLPPAVIDLEALNARTR
jgi:hypothetical protein